MENRFLTEEEACQLLHISREAMLKFKRDPVNAPPALKVGRRYLYDIEKLITWAEKNFKRHLQKLPTQNGGRT